MMNLSSAHLLSTFVHSHYQMENTLKGYVFDYVKNKTKKYTLGFTVHITNLNGLSVIYAGSPPVQAPLQWLTLHPSASGPSCPGRLQSSWGLGSLLCPPGGQRAAYRDQALDLRAISNIVTRSDWSQQTSQDNTTQQNGWPPQRSFSQLL